MIIKLERAVPDDWSDYISLYSCDHLNLIYTWAGSEQRVSKGRSFDWYFGDERNPDYQKDDFLRELFSPGFIKYMIRIGDEPKGPFLTVGFIELDQLRNNTYRITDWVMSMQEYKNETWEALLQEKIPHCKRFSIFMQGDAPTIRWLEELGFRKSAGGYGVFTRPPKPIC